MKKLIIFIMLFIGFTKIMAVDKQDFIVKHIVSVYDGDTFRADLNCTNKFFCKNIPIRVYGVDTPEMKGGSKTVREKVLAHKAQKVTKKFLTEAMNSRGIILKDCFRGKYFRLVCKVRNGNCDLLSKLLIKKGLGVEYFGKKKVVDWSKR